MALRSSRLGIIESVSPPQNSMLSRWYTGGYEDIARIKRVDMDKSWLEVVLREFPDVFDGVKPLCRAIRDVLFPCKDGLFTGTPQDPNILYDPIIKAFNDTIAGIGLGVLKR
ncbi:uncharacterized protein TRIVIDRAFT_221698 [Trichoderma virens Gv29-8]|uniref:Uncharacterized protein n=1 Tax=Hypocrea virens (strain Gv29-8 / FGSC 10586) TaxID=413071 RepID=G9MTR9_HYPVG|nr:uncharacterized protein TRIVIDRAFT_221698 [Trichoderma virens Gv29-8]EHK22418.1 hypothetical protein TRIVIDRAFT_221698 [Trichoderma virens Gv29-8]UKZ47458.1 hypothetical protein TrVGV298_001676 [Trichoderma virens]